VTIARPQPLGVLPWPAGLLLLPESKDAANVTADLIMGRIPADWPAELEYLRHALEGNIEMAVDCLPGTDPISRYNRAVLVGGDGVWEALAAETTGDLHALVEVGAFSVGLTNTPPSAEGTTGEIAAMVLSARASAYLEAGNVNAALEELGAAIAAADSVPSPVLAATMRLTRAELLREAAGNPMAANTELDAGIRLLPADVDPELRAEMYVARGMARHELGQENPGYLLPAVNDFTEAAKTFREDTHPERFAIVSQQLALAYLIMPMSSEGDRIRVGVAVNSLRAALRIFTPETHPAAWASTQLNLANALQYLPSVHQEENLDEAVNLYEEILQHRDPDLDPLGYARILANQGNALGHLGVFSDARQRLATARDIFARQGDAESVAGVDEIITSLNEAEAAR